MSIDFIVFDEQDLQHGVMRLVIGLSD
jgi:hypothetical protein